MVSSRKKWWASLSRSCLFFSLPSYLCSLLYKGSCGCQADEVIKVDEDSQGFCPHCSNWELLWKINFIISALNFIYGQFILLNYCASIVLEWLPSLLSIYVFDVFEDSSRIPSQSLSLPSYTRQRIPATSCKINSPLPGSSNPSSSALGYGLVVQRLASAKSPAGHMLWPCKIWSD